MPIPAIVGAAIATGAAGVGGAAIAAHAAGSAADKQAEASEKGTDAQLQAAREALDFQKQQYNNTQRAVNPYQNYGTGALAMLGSGLGVRPPGPGQSGNVPLGTVTTGPTETSSQSPLLAAQPLRPLQNVTHANLSPGQQLTVAQQQTQSGVGMVRMQSPDGSETQSVPANQAQFYLSKGAKVVG